MKERPILFSAPMVRALLAGTKTQTRRVVKEPGWATPNTLHVFNGMPWADDPFKGDRDLPCPYGQPGDRLWVREAWKRHCGVDTYRADWSETSMAFNGIAWKPSIHMPRTASRITLEVTGVRVERLQDISQPDAIAEGAPPSHPTIDTVSRSFGYPDFSRSWYGQLWEQINGPGSWEANPFVWVVEFRRVTP